MNFNTLPDDAKDVVFKIKESSAIYTGTFIDGRYLTTTGKDETVDFQPGSVECWDYVENVFNTPQTMQPEPETIIIPTRDYSALMWEQRRYEIAKDVLAGMVQSTYGDVGPKPNEIKYDCGYAISYADTLIEMLKNNGQ